MKPTAKKLLAHAHITETVSAIANFRRKKKYPFPPLHSTAQQHWSAKMTELIFLHANLFQSLPIKLQVGDQITMQMFVALDVVNICKKVPTVPCNLFDKHSSHFSGKVFPLHSNMFPKVWGWKHATCPGITFGRLDICGYFGPGWCWHLWKCFHWPGKMVTGVDRARKGVYTHLTHTSFVSKSRTLKLFIDQWSNAWLLATSRRDAR